MSTTTTPTPPEAETEKKPHKYTAEQYLRFTIKAAPLIESLAAHLDNVGLRFANEGPNADHIGRQLGFHSHEFNKAVMDYKQFVTDIENTAKKLREYNTTIAKIYTHSPDSASVHPGNVGYHLEEAVGILKKSLNDPRLSQYIILNGKTTNLLEEIEERLTPVIGDGLQMQEVIREYQRHAGGRMAAAMKGILPKNEVGMASITVQSPPHNLGKHPTVEQVVTHVKTSKPVVSSKKPDPILQKDGAELRGTKRYEYLKTEAAQKLIAQGETLEENRDQNVKYRGSKTRKLFEERLAILKGEKEPQR